ncbi:MAG TPA: sigma-E factor regulatory protein RseB domain-containing protein [Candidatus Saccharimonadales bacterium]|nr:sigma-E factor regulatory protein RseB domain-containing protein [Candidatus Saccharimonadales bacterium]
MKNHLLLSAFLLMSALPVAAQGSATNPTAEEIVARMTAHDLARQNSTEGYAGMRRYVLENQKFHKRAEMLVEVQGDKDGTKHFEVVSEDGWKAAHKHVLHKMLESETETSRPEMRARARLIPENYDFAVVGTELVAGRAAYVLEIRPKRNEHYLFEGRIWVDALDYALARAEGKPAKKPSFWTKSIHFAQIYQKCGPVWFPLSTQSVTEAHLFGTTDVNIEYFDYTPRTPQSTENSIVSAAVTHRP